MDNGTILIKFYASWCLPCKSLSNTVHKVILEFPNIQIKEVNIDEDVESSREYKIRSIPTLVLVKDGQEIDRVVGNQSEEFIRKFLTR